jgi:hypothetical protein
VTRQEPRIVEADRKDYCFFFQDQPGMLNQAAETLQKRREKTREASHDRRLTMWGLWLAVIALFLNTILTIIGFSVNKYN